VLKRTDPDPLGADEPSIRETFGQLLDDGRAYARAELDLVKLRARAEANRYRKAAILGGVAAALGLAALVAFAMTLVIGFARLLGPFGGGAAAVLLLGLGAYAFMSLAQGAIEDRPGASDDGDDHDRG
jgi:hypothetical protein